MSNTRDNAKEYQRELLLAFFQVSKTTVNILTRLKTALDETIQAYNQANKQLQTTITATPLVTGTAPLYASDIQRKVEQLNQEVLQTNHAIQQVQTKLSLLQGEKTPLSNASNQVITNSTQELRSLNQTLLGIQTELYKHTMTTGVVDPGQTMSQDKVVNSFNAKLDPLFQHNKNLQLAVKQQLSSVQKLTEPEPEKPAIISPRSKL